MPAHGYPAEGQLVAVAGEEVVCPECGFIEAVFTGDAFGPAGRQWPADWKIAWTADWRDANCSSCGALWLLGPGGGRTKRAAERGQHLVALHLRSGAWAGWRSIGAE